MCMKHISAFLINKLRTYNIHILKTTYVTCKSEMFFNIKCIYNHSILMHDSIPIYKNN